MVYRIRSAARTDHLAYCPDRPLLCRCIAAPIEVGAGQLDGRRRGNRLKRPCSRTARRCVSAGQRPVWLNYGISRVRKTLSKRRLSQAYVHQRRGPGARRAGAANRNTDVCSRRLGRVISSGCAAGGIGTFDHHCVPPHAASPPLRPRAYSSTCHVLGEARLGRILRHLLAFSGPGVGS